MKVTFSKMILSENAKNNKCLEITFGIQLHPGFLANLSNTVLSRFANQENTGYIWGLPGVRTQKSSKLLVCL
jgi:hypothetical protein